jgi:opacity protein-like surface antigen
MKKFFTMVALATGVMSVQAADVSASYVRDLNLDQDGVRVQASAGSMLGLVPTVSVTHIDGAYTRYALGTQVELAKLGPVAVSVTGAGVYQNTFGADNGYGMTVGAQAEMSLTKSVSVVAGVERFLGQSRVQPFVGNQATVGLAVKF